MKKIILLTSICVLALLVGCSKQDYYNVPLGSDGRALITQISKATSTGITVLDPSFTVDITFATAKAGDVMVAEIVQLRLPTAAEGGGTTKQLLPLAGSKKNVTVGADLKASVTYTRAEANLVTVGDYVKVTFSGATDSGIQRVDLVGATTVGAPILKKKAITLMRIPDVAWIYNKVKPAATYTGTVAVTMKNGANEPWVNVGTGTFAGTDSIPVSGADFAAGKDTMFYKFVATQAGYTETTTTKVIVQNPTFLFKRSAVTLTVAAATGGRNLLTNASIKADSSLAMLAIDGSLVLQGGSVWDAVAGNSIEFVPTTKAKYDAGRSDVAMTDFAAVTPVGTIDTKVAPSYYIFKMVKGAAVTDVYYGMIYITGIVPSTSATIEYKIGNQYEHLLTIK